MILRKWISRTSQATLLEGMSTTIFFFLGGKHVDLDLEGNLSLYVHPLFAEQNRHDFVRFGFLIHSVDSRHPQRDFKPILDSRHDQRDFKRIILLTTAECCFLGGMSL